MEGPKTSESTPKEFLERTKTGWVAETAPLHLGVPGKSEPELPQDPETCEQRFLVPRCGGPEGEEDLSNRFLEVVKPPVVPNIFNLS